MVERQEMVKLLSRRQAELRERLASALERATSSKAQYDEIAQLLSHGAGGELAERLQKIRQAKLAENAAAVEEVRDLAARIQVHEELLAALGEVEHDGAQ